MLFMKGPHSFTVKMAELQLMAEHSTPACIEVAWRSGARPATAGEFGVFKRKVGSYRAEAIADLVQPKRTMPSCSSTSARWPLHMLSRVPRRGPSHTAQLEVAIGFAEDEVPGRR